MKSTIKVLNGHSVMVNPSDYGDCMTIRLERDAHLLAVLMNEDQINALMFSMECSLHAMKTRRELDKQRELDNYRHAN